MDNIKSIGLTMFFTALLVSNLGIVMEGLLVVFPSSTNYSFTGQTTKEIADLDTEILAIAADKMNVFYIGVENPITIAVSGMDNKNLLLTAEGANIKESRNGQYLVVCSQPGQLNLMVTNKNTGKSKTMPFRVKRIPDPVVKMGRKTNGLMGSGEFKAQPGLTANLENFDMDARCAVQSYTLFYVRKYSDPVALKGTGGRFMGRILSAIREAKPGDQYAFTDVKVNCPGDIAGRRVNGLSFKIR